MASLSEVTLCCPVCATEFVAAKVESRGVLVGKRTDFRECYKEQGGPALLNMLHLCEVCGFTGPERWYDEPAVEFTLRARCDAVLAPNVPWARESAVERYWHALKIATWSNENPAVIADVALHGAWAAVEEQDTESERYFRREAALQFSEALRSFDGVPAHERATLTYLVGELWRRMNEYDVAGQWFESVRDEVIDPSSQAWVIRAAEQQRYSPREWFA